VRLQCQPLPQNSTTQLVFNQSVEAKGSALSQTNAIMDAPEPGGRPPVGTASDPHECGNEKAAHDGGVDQNRKRHTKAELLDIRYTAGQERGKDDGDQQGSGGDDSSGALQAKSHSIFGVLACVVLFLDT
jgi:hypothetical protein